MNEKDEPTVHVHTVIDVRTFAKAVYVLSTHQTFKHNSSWSNVARACVEGMASQCTMDFTVETALAFMRNENFPIRQLIKRGRGIRQSLGGYDDVGIKPSFGVLTGEAKENFDAMFEKAGKEVDEAVEIDIAKPNEAVMSLEEADEELRKADEAQAKLLQDEIRNQGGGD